MRLALPVGELLVMSLLRNRFRRPLPGVGRVELLAVRSLRLRALSRFARLTRMSSVAPLVRVVLRTVAVRLLPLVVSGLILALLCFVL